MRLRSVKLETIETMKRKTTEAQHRAILNFVDALSQLSQAGVAIVRNNDDDSLMFFNDEDVKEFVSYDEKDMYPEAVDITDYADEIEVGCIINHAYYPDYGKERILAILNEQEG